MTPVQLSKKYITYTRYATPGARPFVAAKTCGQTCMDRSSGRITENNGCLLATGKKNSPAFPNRVLLSAIGYLLMLTLNVYVREWHTCTNRRSNHMVTCPVLIVTWTVDGFSKLLGSDFTRSPRKPTKRFICRLYNIVLLL